MSRSPRRVDIRDIAKRAHVSTATVSRTINRIPTVNPELARRVWITIEELGYYPNTQARALVSGRSRTFGIIISQITNPFFPEMVHAFETIATQNNYEILVTSTENDSTRMEHAVRRMIERRVEGVAVMTFGMEEGLLEGLKLREIPLVFVDVGPPKPLISTIHIDYYQGIRQAAEHLAALGHETIAFITGPLHLKSALARRQAFVRAVEEMGQAASAELTVEGDHTMEGGMAAFAKLLSRTKKPTAVMCSNDMTAIGVMRKCYEEGIRIPEDVSVIGFDDIHLAQFVLPPLTTVQMSQAKLGRLAFEALITEVGRTKPAPEGTDYSLQTTLVVRQSTAAPRIRVGRKG